MKGFNLSDWALHHRSLVWFLMIIAVVAGTLAYLGLGREEDPPFTIKTMVVSGSMPGATVTEMTEQVTDRIENLPPMYARPRRSSPMRAFRREPLSRASSAPRRSLQTIPFPSPTSMSHARAAASPRRS